MSDRVIVRVSGVDILQRELQDILNSLDPKELTNLLYAAAKPIADEAKKNLEPHRRTGLLAKYITRSKGRPFPGRAQVAIGIKKGTESRKIRPPSGLRGILRVITGNDVKRIQPARYAHLVEDDFEHIFTGRRIQGSRFMSKAIAAKGPETQSAVMAGLLRIFNRRRGGS